MSFDYKRWKEQQYSAANDTPVPADGCPTAVYLVGMIWAALGLILLLTFLMLSLKFGKPFQYVGLIPFGLIHLSSGLRTIYGTAAGTIRSGIVSVVLGLTWVMVAAMSAGPATTNPNAHPNAPLMVLGIAAVGGMLLLAGCLAMIASASYQRWCDPYGSGASTGAPIQKQRVNRPTRPEKETAPKPSIPGWAWVFAAGCGIIPVLTLGGAIPGAIGFGGAGACIGAARNASMSLWGRVAACVAITAGCWVLVILLLGGAVLFVKPSATSGNSKPSATIEDYGRYGSKGRIHTETNCDASGGVDVLSDESVFLVEQTDQIPCKVGERWGIRIRCYDVSANRPYTVRQEMYHPPIRQPDGSVLTKSVREVNVRSGGSHDQYCGWYFLKGYEYELVAGEWSLVVFIDDVEVARKSFHVRK